MTWVGDAQEKKPSEAKKAKLEADRAALVAKIEELKKVDTKKFRFPHQSRQHQEDLINLAHEVVKIDHKLGRPVDWNSGVRK